MYLAKKKASQVPQDRVDFKTTSNWQTSEP